MHLSNLGRQLGILLTAGGTSDTERVLHIPEEKNEGIVRGTSDLSARSAFYPSHCLASSAFLYVRNPAIRYIFPFLRRLNQLVATKQNQHESTDEMDNGNAPNVFYR